MTPTVACLSRRGLVVGAVVFIFLLGIARSAPADGCRVTGTFDFTATSEMGRLVLSADGRAAMLLASHSTFEPFFTSLTGTYRTFSLDNGSCSFGLELARGPEVTDGTLQIYGAVGFQGLVLMFRASSDPGLGLGLAIRTDMLTGQ